MGKSNSKLLGKKASASRSPEKEKKVCICYEIPGSKEQIRIMIKNVSRQFQAVDLTKSKMYFFKENADFNTAEYMHTFETENPGQSGISSKWELSLVVNPTVVDVSRLQLCLYMARHKCTDAKSIDSNVVVPICANWEGSIRVVCNDLVESNKEADRKIQNLFENMLTKMEPVKNGYNYNAYSSQNAGAAIGWMTWNADIITALKEVSRTKRLDLVLDGCVTFSGLSAVKLPQPQVKVQEFRTEIFVPESNKEWMQIRKSLLNGSHKSISDVKLVFPESKTKIETHRFILEAFSPVFCKMFETEMLEKETGEISIEDISYTGMKYALELLYMGDSVDLMSMAEADDIYLTKYAEEIVYIAEKYQIDYLKRLCDSNLGRACNEGNALQLYQTAERFGLENAKKHIMRFIKTNFPD